MTGKQEISSEPALIGRPPVEINYDMLKRYASRALSQEDTATFLGISLATFKRRLKDDELFKANWDEGLATARMSLRTLQWRHAQGKGPAAVSMTIHMSKHLLGENDKTTHEHANKDGKPFEIAPARPTSFLGVDLETASPDVLAALKVVAEAQEAAIAEAARDITGDVEEA